MQAPHWSLSLFLDSQAWILKWGGLESSSGMWISLNGKTKRMYFFLLIYFHSSFSVSFFLSLLLKHLLFLGKYCFVCVFFFSIYFPLIIIFYICLFFLCLLDMFWIYLIFKVFFIYFVRFYLDVGIFFSDFIYIDFKFVNVNAIVDAQQFNIVHCINIYCI